MIDVFVKHTARTRINGAKKPANTWGADPYSLPRHTLSTVDPGLATGSALFNAQLGHAARDCLRHTT